MKRLTWTLLLVSFALTACSQDTGVASDSDIEKEIWALENSYLKNHRDANHDKIASLWHDKFLGWPDNLPQPADKAGVIQYTKQRNAKPGSWNFKIEPKGIQVQGDIVINHYLLKIGGTSTRVTHTWVKEDSQWRILGGMSNRH